MSSRTERRCIFAEQRQAILSAIRRDTVPQIQARARSMAADGATDRTIAATLGQDVNDVRRALQPENNVKVRNS
ncbi:MAG: hypothetical protein ABIQ86_12800 [Steroidobacteraceae bacterium]